MHCRAVWRLINKPTNRSTDIHESVVMPMEDVSKASKTVRSELLSIQAWSINHHLLSFIGWFPSLCSLVPTFLSPQPSSPIPHTHIPANSPCTWHLVAGQTKKKMIKSTKSGQVNKSRQAKHCFRNSESWRVWMPAVAWQLGKLQYICCWKPCDTIKRLKLS